MDQVGIVRDRTDIVSLIAESVKLKHAGRNFKGLCPFHSEKTPSFMVSPERQIWHCFGCGKGGDAYTFLMEFERVEFPEALRILAKKAGITLTQSAFAKEAASQKEQSYRVNRLAADFYHYVLTSHPAGKPGLSYLKNRGVSEKTLKTFSIGFAPRVGTALSQYLVKKKRTPETLLFDTGLAYRKGRDAADFFRGRIVFPLIDHRENVVGFSGRVLEHVADGPKYINTKDTPIYHKRDHFFGINITKEAIKKEDQAILVEGEFDVLSMFQEGFGNVLAVKGTALTDNQVALLARFAKKVTMCFDGDRAGQDALKRSLPIVEKKGLTVTVIALTNGKDPDEAIKNNPLDVKKAVKSDISAYEYLLIDALSRIDPTTPDGKKQISDDLLPIFAAISNEIVKEHFFRKLSDALSTSYESITKELARYTQKEQKYQRSVPPKEKRSREELLEEYLLALILQHASPKEAYESINSLFHQVLGMNRASQKLLRQLRTFMTDHDSYTHDAFQKTLPEELTSLYDTSLLFPLHAFSDQESWQKELQMIAMQLSRLYVKEKLRTITNNLKKTPETDDEHATVLQQEYDTWLKLLEKID